VFLVLCFSVLSSTDLAQAVRIKDMAHIKGVRTNQLLGYGLVVGLDGTGDDDKTEFTIQSLVSMLEKMGIVVNPRDVDVDNIAAVMVTANLRPFARVGTRIDVLVSSIGNAESLQGGTLLMTPLKAPNGEVYAVAQGPISIGGFSYAGATGSGVQKNHPTAAQIVGGAIIEREISLDLTERGSISITLDNPDFTTSLRMATTIEVVLDLEKVQAIDAGTVYVELPEKYKGEMVHFISKLENLEITPDTVAKIVLNERTGTVVMGEKVRISTIAVSHGSLSILIKEQPTVSQPLPFSRGRTVVLPQTEVSVAEEEAKLMVMQEGVNIGEVVRGLNAIGVTPRDLTAILQAIKAAGALQAELEII
jgi:flagellar P-ring protein precursor FlgI